MVDFIKTPDDLSLRPGSGDFTIKFWAWPQFDSIGPTPWSNQNVDVGPDGLVDIVVTDYTYPTFSKIVWFTQDPLTGNNTGMDYVEFPITVGGYTFINGLSFEDTPRIRRLSTYSYMFFTGDTGGGSPPYAVIVETCIGGVVARNIAFTTGSVRPTYWSEGFDDGTIIIVYDHWYPAGGGLYADVSIVMRKSTDFGVTWSEEIEIISHQTTPSYGSAGFSLYKSQDNNLYLSFGYITSEGYSVNTYCFISTDKGSSWAEKIIEMTGPIVQALYPVPIANSNKIYVSKTGWIVSPFFWYSANGGISWNRVYYSANLRPEQYAQMAINNDSWLALLNSSLYKSTNGGASFTSVFDPTSYGGIPYWTGELRHYLSTFGFAISGAKTSVDALVYFYSSDDGDTWSVKNLGIVTVGVHTFDFFNLSHTSPVAHLGTIFEQKANGSGAWALLLNADPSPTGDASYINFMLFNSITSVYVTLTAYFNLILNDWNFFKLVRHGDDLTLSVNGVIPPGGAINLVTDMGLLPGVSLDIM
jgi:hypothetical protein